MKNNNQNQDKLPLECSFDEALKIYIKRLAIFLVVVLANFSLLGLLTFVSAQVGSTATPTPQPTAPPTAIPTLTLPQVTATPNTVTPSDLVEHFERVTEFTMNTITIVVTLLGVLGIVAGYLSLKTIRGLEKIVVLHRFSHSVLCFDFDLF